MRCPLATPEQIRATRAENPKLRDRDLADRLGISEAALVAADAGDGVTRIIADPDALIPRLAALGEVMALTRNDSAVHEKVGTYANYTPGQHAAMVLTEEIDLRIFPRHWVHAFAVERAAEGGPRRSLQVFDAAGDAVHKVHLRAGSDLAAWEALVADLALDDQSGTVAATPREPTEVPKADPAKADILRQEWRRMTDTHQFLRLVSKLKMNRLGAYRIAGAPFARPLAPESVDAALGAVAAAGIPFMLFVGNRGCIQIHSGPIHTLQPMGPWQNVMDPGFNLHLRRDHVAEVWAVEKPTARGPAISIEAFDAAGGLILQAFGYRKEREGIDHTAPWSGIVAGLPTAQIGEMAQ
jgi:putative hemin transport protein